MRVRKSRVIRLSSRRDPKCKTRPRKEDSCHDRRWLRRHLFSYWTKNPVQSLEHVALASGFTPDCFRIPGVIFLLQEAWVSSVSGTAPGGELRGGVL